MNREIRKSCYSIIRRISNIDAIHLVNYTLRYDCID